jgi:hypothetical protein
MDNLNKPVIVLKALLAGLEVDLGGVKVFLGENDQGQRVLAHAMWNLTENKPKYIGMPVELDRFIGICEAMSDDDVTLIAANTTLNDIKHEGADRRPKDREDEDMEYRGKVHAIHHPEPGVDLP